MPLSRKEKEKLTVMIIPHTGREPASVKIPISTPRFIAAALVVFAFFLAVFIYSYAYLASQMDELAHLQEVTEAQKAKISLLSDQTLQLRVQVEEVEELSRQIKEILGLVEQAEAGAVEAEGAMEAMEAMGSGAGGRDLLADRSGFRTTLSTMELESLQASMAAKAKELEDLVEAAEDYQHRMDHTPSIWPTEGRITSPFGYRRSPFTRRIQFHGGIDIASSSGTPILAAANGRVVEASYRSGWGRLIILEHGYDFITYYAHLRGFAVAIGDTVSKGEVIGYMGNSGSSTGTHLHYEVHYRGERMNPRDYMN